MESVRRAKDRLRKYPLLIVECNKSAAKYASCVIRKSDVRKDDCQAEYNEFKRCLVKAAAKNKTKL